MEEQFVLRVPPSVAERLKWLLNGTDDPTSSGDKELDLSFSEDGRNGTFAIGKDTFPASLLDLPSVIESYKAYDDGGLIKTADIGQMIVVREVGDRPAPPDSVEYRHGLTPPMRDARRHRFRREPDLNPEVVQRVERYLWNIMRSGTAEGTTGEEDGNYCERNVSKKLEPKPTTVKPHAPDSEANMGEAERSDSDESEDSI